MNKKHLFAIYCFAISILIGYVSIYYQLGDLRNDITCAEKLCDTVYLTVPQHEFIDGTPQENIEDALDYFNVRFKRVVIAQSKLETAHYTSNIYITTNNMFGLSRAGKYYKFNRWWESIVAYKTIIQNRYEGGDTEEEYLQWIGTFYAEDTLYISKLKRIIGLP